MGLRSSQRTKHNTTFNKNTNATKVIYHWYRNSKCHSKFKFVGINGGTKVCVVQNLKGLAIRFGKTNISSETSFLTDWYKIYLPIHLEITVRRPILVFSCDQSALRTLISVCQSARLSVRPSVCLSVRLSVYLSQSVCLSVCLYVCLSHIFIMFLSSNHHEIYRSHYRWQKWRPSKRSRSEVKGHGHRG